MFALYEIGTRTESSGAITKELTKDCNRDDDVLNELTTSVSHPVFQISSVSLMIVPVKDA